MSSLNHKRRRSRSIRLELLESRELLSAVGLPAHQAAEVAPLAKISVKTLKGSLSGRAVVTPVSITQGTVSLSASGTGGFDFTGSDDYSVNKKHAIKYTSGVGILSGSGGDQVDVSFTGSGKETGVASFTFSVKGPVKGGAGTFAGAAGKFTAKGSFDGATGVLSVNYTVKFTRD